jgi:glycosyltransferase involved in cell wall biosynthesis
LRLAVYTDYQYHRVGGEIRSERAFSIFLARIAEELGGLVLLGRLASEEARGRYPVGGSVEFHPLPYYPSLASPVEALRGMGRSLRRSWKAMDAVDGIWLLGPHPLAIVLAGLAALRGKGVVLGVRQDLPRYVRHRHPRRPLLRVAGRALEWGYRALARAFPVVVVGPHVARNFRSARRRLEIVVSLVSESEIRSPAQALRRHYDGELTLLSVGRIDREKNPLILADILALLRRRDPRWRLIVAGEGPMLTDLSTRLAALGLAEHAELRGYVPLDPGLMELYRTSHALLHASWTEGLPQVLLEAFAAGVPVVATDVGGVGEAVGEMVRLVPPGDPAAAALALGVIVEDTKVRERLVRAGHDYVLDHTIDTEVRRVVDFLRASLPP